MSSRVIVLLELPTGPCSKQHATLGAVTMRGALEDVDQVQERPVEAEDRILTAGVGIVEEFVTDALILINDNLFGAVAQDHVVNALVRGSRNLGVRLDDRQVIRKAAVPVLLAIVRLVVTACDHSNQIVFCRHVRAPPERFRSSDCQKRPNSFEPKAHGSSRTAMPLDGRADTACNLST